MFARKGYKAATNKEIAAEAGVTTAALYYYFPSKEAMFQEVVSMRQAPLEQVRRTLGAFRDLPPDRLLPMALGVVAEVVKNPEALEQGRFVIGAGLHDPAVTNQTYTGFFRPLVGEFKAYFDHQIALGHMRPVDSGVAAAAMLAPIFGMVIWRVFMGEIPEVPWDPVIRFTLDEFLAWVVPDAALDAAPAGEPGRENGSAQDRGPGAGRDPDQNRVTAAKHIPWTAPEKEGEENA